MAPFDPEHSPGMTDLMVTPESIDKFLDENPPNLALCEECGHGFDKPVTREEALKYFPSVEVASFACRDCSSQWGEEQTS